MAPGDNLIRNPLDRLDADDQPAPRPSGPRDRDAPKEPSKDNLVTNPLDDGHPGDNLIRNPLDK